MSLLHRPIEDTDRRGRGRHVALLRLRLPLPLPPRSRAVAIGACALAAAVGIFWFLGGGTARAVTTSTTAVTSSTITSEFILKGAAKTQVDTLTAQAQTVQADIEALNTELELMSEQYNKCLDDLDAANTRMAELRRTVADAQTEKTQRQAQLARRLKAVYMTGGRDQLLQILLLSDGLEDLYNRVRLVSTLADRDRRLVTDLKETSSRLDLLMQAADQQKRLELRLRGELAAHAREIQAKLGQRERTLAAVDQRVQVVIEQEKQRQKAEQERLQAELQAELRAKLQVALLVSQSHVLNGGQIYRGKLPQTDDVAANQLIQTAAAYLGVSYVWGGSRPSSGMDCSGFTRYVYGQHGIKLPHYSGYQAQMGAPVALDDIQPGDLLAFGFPVHHVGIYIGDGLYIHTPSEVKISRLSARRDLAAIRRFPIQTRVGDPRWD